MPQRLGGALHLNSLHSDFTSDLPYLTVGFSLYKGSVVLCDDLNSNGVSKGKSKEFDDGDIGSKDNVTGHGSTRSVIARINYGGEAKVQLYQSSKKNSTSTTHSAGENIAMTTTLEGKENMVWDFKMDLLDFEVVDGGLNGTKIVSFDLENSGNKNRSEFQHATISGTDDVNSDHHGPIMSLSFTSMANDSRPSLCKNKIDSNQVFYSFDFFERLGSFQSAIPKNEDVEKAAYETLENIQVWAEQEVSELVASQTKFSFEVKVLSPQLLIPLSRTKNLTVNLGHLKLVYGESKSDSSVTTTTIRMGHLEIDDRQYSGTSFFKLATSKTLSKGEDLVHILSTRNASTKELKTHVVFHQLELQWNADTLHLLFDKLGAPRSNQSMPSLVSDPNSVMDKTKTVDQDSPTLKTSNLKTVEEEENEVYLNLVKDNDTVAPKRKSSTGEKSTATWMNNVSIEMKSVSLTLNKEKIQRHIVKLQMTDTKLQIDTIGAYFGVKGTLGNLSALDMCTSDTHHPMIIDNNRTNESLLQFSYRTLDDDAVSVINKTPNVFKTANVKVGKHLKGSGQVPWNGISNAIDVGAGYGNIPGKNLFYIQKYDNKVYYYGFGDESGTAGPDTWSLEAAAEKMKLKSLLFLILNYAASKLYICNL